MTMTRWLDNSGIVWTSDHETGPLNGVTRIHAQVHPTGLLVVRAFGEGHSDPILVLTAPVAVPAPVVKPRRKLRERLADLIESIEKTPSSAAMPVSEKVLLGLLRDLRDDR